MFLANPHPSRHMPLPQADAALLGPAAADTVAQFLEARPGHAVTPLHRLPGLAADLGIGSLAVKDEGFRLGLGSFKALGGAYAVIRLVLEEAARQLKRPVPLADLHDPAVRAIAATMTFACATDGNHGRSVAQGAREVGARCIVFVHGAVSQPRVDAIASFGAEIRRVAGSYDDSVAEAARVAAAQGWTIVSDTSWEGYERIPGLVMQGYTAMAREALAQMADPPTHVFVQAGVGGVAAAVGAYMALALGAARPVFTVVEPSRSACIFESARAGHAHRIAAGEATVMAMLECYDPSPLAFRILSHVADGFITAEDDDAIEVMNRLARPSANDPAIVAGESGAAGLAGLLCALRDPAARAALRLDAAARVLVFNTEGATDPGRYAELVGLAPGMVG
jgi:diaminopropionate ammonia-lyase